jgi:hypothetical protein
LFLSFFLILAQSLPISKDTKRLQSHRAALEDEITRLDEGIKAYSRTPVSGSEACKQSRRVPRKIKTRKGQKMMDSVGQFNLPLSVILTLFFPLLCRGKVYVRNEA